jgi:hypothetical protein
MKVKFKIKNRWNNKKEEEEIYLLEKWKGERTPEESLAAQPKALCGCSSSGDFLAILSLLSTLQISLLMGFDISTENTALSSLSLHIKWET